MIIDSISKIQSNLHSEALDTGFYTQSEEELKESANDFVAGFCSKHTLTAHTISPMRWNFESDDYGMFDDGVIELVNIENAETQFKSVVVADAKVTDPE